MLHAWVAALDPALDRDAAFDAVRASFNAQVCKREDAVGLAGDALESAFDFMESAFADGQEMVVLSMSWPLGRTLPPTWPTTNVSALKPTASACCRTAARMIF